MLFSKSFVNQTSAPPHIDRWRCTAKNTTTYFEGVNRAVIELIQKSAYDIATDLYQRVQ